MRILDSKEAVDSAHNPGGGSLREFPPVSLSEVRKRVDKILDSLASETNLPIGLRSALAEEMVEFQALAGQRSPDRQELSRRIKAIAFYTYSYDRAVVNSQTVADIRILDLELEDWLEDGSHCKYESFDLWDQLDRCDRAS